MAELVVTEDHLSLDFRPISALIFKGEVVIFILEQEKDSQPILGLLLLSSPWSRERDKTRL